MVALALDPTHMGLDLDFEDGGGFRARKRPECGPTDRAAFLRGAQGMGFDHHGEGGAVPAAVPRTAGLLSPLTGAA
jgi:hypothetical protein